MKKIGTLVAENVNPNVEAITAAIMETPNDWGLTETEIVQIAKVAPATVQLILNFGAPDGRGYFFQANRNGTLVWKIARPTP